MEVEISIPSGYLPIIAKAVKDNKSFFREKYSLILCLNSQDAV